MVYVPVPIRMIWIVPIFAFSLSIKLRILPQLLYVSFCVFFFSFCTFSFLWFSSFVVSGCLLVHSYDSYELFYPCIPKMCRILFRFSPPSANIMEFHLVTRYVNGFTLGAWLCRVLESLFEYFADASVWALSSNYVFVCKWLFWNIIVKTRSSLSYIMLHRSD